MAEFDYKQRPFSSTVTDDHYDRIFKRGKYAKVTHTELAEMSNKLDGLIKTHESGPCEVCKSYRVPVIHRGGYRCIVCGTHAAHTHEGRTL
jgi:hypothetical protein